MEVLNSSIQERAAETMLQAHAKFQQEREPGETRDERIRMYRPGDADTGTPFGWCSVEDADKMVNEGLARWRWNKRKLEVDSMYAGIRGSSCSMSGLSHGYEQDTELVDVPVSVVAGKVKYRKQRIPSVTPGDPRVDLSAGEPVLVLRLGPTESFALNPEAQEAWREVYREETAAGQSVR